MWVSMMPPHFFFKTKTIKPFIGLMKGYLFEMMIRALDHKVGSFELLVD
jgi:hypothetical protein